MNKKAALEALLFSTSEPVTVEDLSRALIAPVAVVSKLIAELDKEYAAENRGFFLERVSGGYRLCTKEEYASIIDDLGKTVRTAPLSPAALETLAIVAYRQPITRPEIEAIRGVRADSAVTSLVDRGLIEEKGRSDGPGKPILYGTTPQFLVRFGLDDVGQLPPLEQSQDPSAD